MISNIIQKPNQTLKQQRNVEHIYLTVIENNVSSL